VICFVCELASSSESELQAVVETLDRKDCEASACDFIERHCFIEEPDGTAVPFKLWDFQRDVVVALEAGEPVIVLKARRLGLSWLVLCFALWLAIFNQGTRILVLCKTEGDATELLDRIRRTLDRIRSDPASQHILSRLERPAKERDAVKTRTLEPQLFERLLERRRLPGRKQRALLSLMSLPSSRRPITSGRRWRRRLKVAASSRSYQLATVAQVTGKHSSSYGLKAPH
jgi:hypothetical protein